VRPVDEVVDADVVLRHRERDAGVAGRQLAESGYKVFDYKLAARSKVTGSILEARDLFVLDVRFVIVLKTR
jgi:hypothetical protein